MVPAGITKIKFERKGLKNLTMSLLSTMISVAIRKVSHSSDMFVKLVMFMFIRNTDLSVATAAVFVLLLCSRL